MADLPRFGSKVEKESQKLHVLDVPGAQAPQRCPVCGSQVPHGSHYCPQCGTLTNRSSEGLAVFSSGPQYALMKAQVAAVQEIQAEAAAIRRNVQWLSAVNTVGWLVLMFLLFAILTRIGHI